MAKGTLNDSRNRGDVSRAASPARRGHGASGRGYRAAAAFFAAFAAAGPFFFTCLRRFFFLLTGRRLQMISFKLAGVAAAATLSSAIWSKVVENIVFQRYVSKPCSRSDAARLDRAAPDRSPRTTATIFRSPRLALFLYSYSTWPFHMRCSFHLTLGY